MRWRGIPTSLRPSSVLSLCFNQLLDNSKFILQRPYTRWSETCSRRISWTTLSEKLNLRLHIFIFLTTLSRTVFICWVITTIQNYVTIQLILVITSTTSYVHVSVFCFSTNDLRYLLFLFRGHILRVIYHVWKLTCWV